MTSEKHDGHMCLLTVAKSKLIRAAEKSTIILYLSSTNRSADWPTHQNWSQLFTLISAADMEKDLKTRWRHDSKNKLLFPLEDRRTGTEKGTEAQKPWSDMLRILEKKQNILQYNLPVGHGALRAHMLKVSIELLLCLAWHGFCLRRGQERDKRTEIHWPAQCGV